MNDFKIPRTSVGPQSMRMHYFTYDDNVTHHKFSVWGFTAAVLIEAARAASGRKETFQMNPLPASQLSDLATELKGKAKL